jgi:hypothetical protein
VDESVQVWVKPLSAMDSFTLLGDIRSSGTVSNENCFGGRSKPQV